MRRPARPSLGLRAATLAAAFLATGGILTAPACAQAPARAENGPEVIILVRHAETAPDGTRDPALSEAGEARAARLADLLAAAGLTTVHSSPYRRTQATASMAASASGLDVVEYDPAALPAFAERLLASPGRHLVVGHSNTTPTLVGLLGGEAGTPIGEDEHGRVYVLVPLEGGVRTVVFRY